MKASVLKNFVQDWTETRGLEREILEADVWKVTVPKGLRERLGGKELTLSFTQRALSKHPESELATVGNPVFDRLLGVAREEGRIGIGYAKPAARAKRPPAAEAAGVIQGIKPAKGEATYQAIYHLIFTITYPSIEAPDEMEILSIDGGSLEVLAQTPDLFQLWERLEPGPRKGRTVLPPLPMPERLIEAGLRALERRMRRRLNKVRSTSRERLDDETKSIKAYYEQLIEEARNQSRRWSTRVEDKEDRIRWLQLEWKRRIEEANQFWKPQVNAYFVGLGIQMVPRVAYRYSVSKGKGRKAVRSGPVRVWDEASKAFLPPYCAGCGKTDLEDPAIGATGEFVCAECATSSSEKSESKKGEAGRRKERSAVKLKILDPAG